MEQLLSMEPNNIDNYANCLLHFPEILMQALQKYKCLSLFMGETLLKKQITYPAFGSAHK